MPVVELNLKKLAKIVGASKRGMAEVIPYLGLDIEGRSGDQLRVEYSPNRPDYSTDYGIAMGLQGLLGVRRGMIRLRIRKGKYSIKADTSVSKIRPYVTCIAAGGRDVDESLLKQLISMQEDLHAGLGRGRRKAAIGVHDISSMTFPLRYTTVSRSHRFVPLHSDRELTVDEILKETEVGVKYGPLLKSSKKMPLILDAKDRTVSFPPVINSARTTVNTKTLGLFIDVTGIDKRVVEDVLSVIALTLQGAGFTLYSVRVSGAGNSTPAFRPRKMRLESRLVNSTLGLDLKPTMISNALRKSRLDASAKTGSIECTIPRYRFDILGEMDLVEEVALGYGINKLGPRLPPSATHGQADPVQVSLQSARHIMTGLGYTEILNSSLTSRSNLYENTGRDSSEMISVVNSKSLEHTILRDSLLPGVISSLASNMHREYPYRLFEIGTVFGKGSPISEQIRLCAVSSHWDVSYTEIKSILQPAALYILGKYFKTLPVDNPLFEAGRSAEVQIDKKAVGVVGEVSKAVRERFRLREPVSAFEIKLPG